MVDVLKLIYGENVSVSQRIQKVFESLLLILEINFSNATTDSIQVQNALQQAQESLAAAMSLNSIVTS